MKKTLSLLAVAALGLITLNSCSKGDGPTLDINKVKTAKFTIQVKGLEANDHALFVFSSGEATANTTLWKINGSERANEKVISLDEDDLKAGATFIIETTRPVVAISTGYTFTNGDNTAHTPVTFSYKAEINGKVANDVKNQAIAAGDNLNIDLSYTE